MLVSDENNIMKFTRTLKRVVRGDQRLLNTSIHSDLASNQDSISTYNEKFKSFACSALSLCAANSFCRHVPSAGLDLRVRNH